MDKRNGLRNRDIEGLIDVMDALDLCDQHGVPSEGLNDLEEIKERLRLHYASKRQGNIKIRIQEAMQRTGEEDEKKRKRLTQMFEELVQIIGTKDKSKRRELVEDLLLKDNTSANLLADCEEKMKNLKERDCVILIAGETNAGKSSFLNLLLGSQFLPTHSVSCTSSITTLRYGTQRRVRVIYGGSEAKVEDIEDLGKEGMERLSNIMYMRGREREEGHNVREVQVFLPIEFLKCGIVLADTPGIGENEFLEKYLMEYISENQILGFIYIIFSDSAGGVQDDRLLLLLKMIIQQQKGNKESLKFDPKAALFLANRFDAIAPEDRENVKSHILAQLGKSWPEFDESLVVFFSTKNARRDVDAHPDYINAKYKTVLEAISNLFSVALDRRIRSTYNWIETVLKRINHYLKATVRRIGMTMRENRENAEKMQNKLQKLRESSDTVIKELLADIEERSQQIVKEVQCYLSTPQAKFLLCSVWKQGEIPEISDTVTDPHHWEWVKQRIDEAFYDRLCDAIEGWENDKCKVSSIEKEIVEDIKLKLGVLQEDISQFEHDMRSTRSSTNSNDSKSSKRLTLQISGTSFVDIPIKLAPKMQHRISNNPVQRMLTRRDTAKFERDPKGWARKRAEKLMEELLKNESKKKSDRGILTQLIDQLMQRPRDIVLNLKIRVPSIIDANIELLHSLEDIIFKDIKHETNYEDMMVQIEGLKESLMNYGEGYIFVNDFKSNEVKVFLDTPTGQSLAQTFRFSELVTGRSTTKNQCITVIPQGLWTIVRPGTLHQDNKEKPISIKMYMPSSGVTHTFQEVAKLRCLLHSDVYLAEFLGIHHTEAVTPAYIFDGHLQPLHKIVADDSYRKSHFQLLFSQIADGLNYLHSKGMVHMELTSSTITVTENGEVRMTGACVPRHANLPLQKENPVADFVYLPPEVLRNELYITSADVYAFGILLFELLCETKAFDSMRNVKFNDFVEAINRESMLPLNSQAQSILTAETLNLIKCCVDISENRRPNMDYVKDRLAIINGDFMVQNSNGHVGRKSTEICTPEKIYRRK